MKIQLKFKWQDMWVGVFHAKGTKYDGAVYLNLLPCLPLEIRWKEEPKPPREDGYVMPLGQIPTNCPECNTPLQKQYFTISIVGNHETGCFIHICLECGRTWRQGGRRYT